MDSSIGKARVKAVERSFLEVADPLVLKRLLMPYRGYLERRGVGLDHDRTDFGWVEQLHRVLTSVDPDMPGQLSQALAQISEMVKNDGHEQVIELANARQLSLFGEDKPAMAPVDVVILTYLDERRLFDDSASRVRSQVLERTVEFYGAPMKPLPKCDERRGRLVKGLRSWFAKRNRTGYVDVRVIQDAATTTFAVIHGQVPRSMGVIRSGENILDYRERTTVVPDKEDTLVVHHETGLLAVTAQFASEMDIYRQMLGELFFQNARYFNFDAVMRGQTLLSNPVDATSIAGFPEFERVFVREVTIEEDGNKSNRHHLFGEDLTEKLSVRGWGDIEDPFVVAYKLAFKIRGRKHPLGVNVRLPNKLKFDRRKHEPLIREFLLTRDFMAIPSANEVKEAS